MKVLHGSLKRVHRRVYQTPLSFLAEKKKRSFAVGIIENRFYISIERYKREYARKNSKYINIYSNIYILQSFGDQPNKTQVSIMIIIKFVKLLSLMIGSEIAQTLTLSKGSFLYG